MELWNTASLLCSVAAVGQTGASLSNQVTPLHIADHISLTIPSTPPGIHMASENPLVGGAVDAYSYAQGERPLWEFGPVPGAVPLGDVARAYRKARVATKKAEVVFEKQGS